jgi:hypothetical protein
MFHNRIHKTWSPEHVWSHSIQLLIVLRQAGRRTELPTTRKLVGQHFARYSLRETSFKQEFSSKRSCICQAVCGISLLSHLWHFSSARMGAPVLLSVISYLKKYLRMATASKHSVKSCVELSDTWNLMHSVLLAKLEHCDLLLRHIIAFCRVVNLCCIVQ